MKENTDVKKPKKPIYKQIWFWVIIVVIIAISASITTSQKKDQPDINRDSNSSEQESDQPDINSDPNSSEQKSDKKDEKSSKWTQEIYDSLTASILKMNEATYKMEYTGGTPYAGLEDKVGKPDSTSSSSLGGGDEIITNSWTTIDWLNKGKSTSVIIQYNKASGLITSKSKTDF